MTNDVARAFELFKRGHRDASDSLVHKTARPDEVRKNLIDQASIPFTQLDEKMRFAFAQSLLSNPLLTEIDEEKVARALERNHFSALVPLHPEQILVYVRHARKRGLDLAAQAGQAALAA